MMHTAWQLIEVETEPEWTPDKSRIYTVIRRIVIAMTHKKPRHEQIRVQVDLIMDNGDLAPTPDVPLISWIGQVDAVRKTVGKYLDENFVNMSYEHAAYIGSEIARAALDPKYVQS